MFAGVDTHKDTLAVAVIDPAGRVVTQLEVANKDSGDVRLLAVLTRHAVTRVGIEGSGNYGWPAATYLLDHGVEVVEVPPLMTSRERQSRPGQGKTDPVDAVAVARITARETSLPPVRPMTGDPADLLVLTEYRDQVQVAGLIFAALMFVAGLVAAIAGMQQRQQPPRAKRCPTMTSKCGSRDRLALPRTRTRSP